jgi:hypothetical protein
MRRLWLAACVVAIACAVPGTASAFSHLQPGVPHANLPERVPVNVVFVGIEQGQVSPSAFRAGLPDRYKPIVRSRLFYGNVEELGLDYRYDFALTYASTSWENSFFAALRGLAQPAARTDFQDIYNDQDGTRDVGQNHFIDAPTVEKWLIDHPPPGVNTRQDTIFFINWWGRSNFVDHVYTKFGEPDPDTGYDFGVNRESRKIIGWGGTTPDDEETGLGSRGVNRVWFFDLSAGPESWGGNSDITNEDLDGDDVADYRIPVAWEYAAGGYRSPSRMAGDLSLVARYSAVNLLFTSSPLYPPYLTPELLPSRIDLDINTYEGWPGVDASGLYLRPDYVAHEERELFPSTWSTNTQDLDFRGKAKDCYVKWVDVRECYRDRPQYPADANLFLYNALNLDDALDHAPDPRSRRYEAPSFNYSTKDDIAAGFLGFADDNWVDGTQSFVFGFISQSVVDSGYGLTTTLIHEYGHHFGMSHPHDGFDWQTGFDYEPTGPFYFTWSGDENNSIMSYIDLNWDFSQFDRDNAARHQAAGYILNANMIAARILASRHANRAAHELADADDAVGQAERAIDRHDYVDTWENARDAYELVLRGADRADVLVEASFNGWSVLPPEHGGHGHRNSIVAYGGFDKFGAGSKRSLP